MDRGAALLFPKLGGIEPLTDPDSGRFATNLHPR
jgi:hypothetical protein